MSNRPTDPNLYLQAASAGQPTASPTPIQINDETAVIFQTLEQRAQFLWNLAALQKSDVLADEACGVCQEPFLALILAAEMVDPKKKSVAIGDGELDVVELPGCGHRFCRKDLFQWVYTSRKDTCPSCRAILPVPPILASPSPIPSLSVLVEDPFWPHEDPLLDDVVIPRLSPWRRRLPDSGGEVRDH